MGPFPFQHDEPARALARTLYQLLEVVHTPVYFSTDVKAASQALGLSNRMMSYCAIRTAPFGELPPEVAQAVFYGFAPRAVAVGLPAAWQVTTPAEVLEMTHATVGGLLDEAFDGLEDDVPRAAELARAAALLHPIIGRPLAAAFASVPWAQEPSVQLWQAASRIRESRGDGHLAQLIAADLDGIASHLTVTGDHPKMRPQLTKLRGWTDPEVDAGVAALQGRGIIGQDGRLTEEGQRLRRHLEDATDDLASRPWQQLGVEASQRLAAALRPLAQRIAEADILPAIVIRKALG